MDTETLPEDARWITMAEGVRRRTLVSGATMMQMLVELKEGSHLPEHRHPQEQIAHVVSGRLRFWVDGAAQEIGAGESLYLKSGIAHAVDALETAVVLDTFSPPREDLLAQDRAESAGRTVAEQAHHGGLFVAQGLGAGEGGLRLPAEGIQQGAVGVGV